MKCTQGEKIVANLKGRTIHLPIVLPDGTCSSSSLYPVKFLKNEFISCSIHNSKLYNYLNDFLHEIDEGISVNDKEEIKKIELKFIVNNTNKSDIKYKYSLEKKKGDIGPSQYQRISIEVIWVNQFDNNREDKIFYRTGNFGYQKGMPLVIGTGNSNNNEVSKIQNSKFLLKGVNPSGECDNTKIYYDKYIGNDLSFEDSILFGCKTGGNCNDLFNEIVKFDEGKEYFVSKVANPQNYSFAWNNLKSDEKLNQGTNDKLLILNFLYGWTGDKINAQGVLIKSKLKSQSLNTNDQCYLKINFFEKKQEYKGKYKPGPAVRKMPRNIMYPFKIGSTKYSEDKR